MPSFVCFDKALELKQELKCSSGMNVKSKQEVVFRYSKSRQSTV